MRVINIYLYLIIRVLFNYFSHTCRNTRIMMQIYVFFPIVIINVLKNIRIFRKFCKHDFLIANNNN